MTRRSSILAMSLLLILPMLSACGGGKENPVSGDSTVPTQAPQPAEREALKQIGQQRSGDYVVTLFNAAGVVKQGPNRFVLEVRNASSQELIPVNEIHIETSMEMQGHPPMAGNGSAIPGNVPGRYEIGSDFAARAPVGYDVSSARVGRMAGIWKLVVTFEPNQRIEFTANLD